MKSKVIVLRGKGNKGKTTTLNLLIKKLVSLPTKILDGAISDSITDDSWVVLKYMGKTIGIITVGDDAKSLDKYFSRITISCDIYVCAARTKGSSCQYIENRFSGCIIMWQEKWSITEWSGTTELLKDLQNDANEKQASALIDAINAL
ncbi:MAG: hypothetical protein PUC88_05860 [Clostridia bacterium]|nr:hypothetical protein [Clostridia bacterium]